jgi:hypothetical protein
MTSPNIYGAAIDATGILDVESFNPDTLEGLPVEQFNAVRILSSSFKLSNARVVELVSVAISSEVGPQDEREEYSDAYFALLITDIIARLSKDNDGDPCRHCVTRLAVTFYDRARTQGNTEYAATFAESVGLLYGTCPHLVAFTYDAVKRQRPGASIEKLFDTIERGLMETSMPAAASSVN